MNPPKTPPKSAAPSKADSAKFADEYAAYAGYMSTNNSTVRVPSATEKYVGVATGTLPVGSPVSKDSVYAWNGALGANAAGALKGKGAAASKAAVPAAPKATDKPAADTSVENVSAQTINPEQIEKTLAALRRGDYYDPNPLNAFENTNYNFRLFMTPDVDAIHEAGGTVPGTVSEYLKLLNQYNQVTIAETGVTGYNIQSVNMESLVGPNHRSETTNMTTMTMTIIEAGGVSFLDSLKNAALQNRVRNYQKCWYFLELTFKGYKPDGSIVTNLLADEGFDNDGRWVWQVQITDIETNLTAAGGEYKLTLIPYFESALEDHLRSVPEMVVAEGNTIREICDDFTQQLNATWQRRTVLSDGLTYAIKFHGAFGETAYTTEKIEGLKLTPDDPKLNPQHGKSMIDTPGDKVERNPVNGKPRAYIPQGTTISQFVQLIMSNCEEAQRIAFDNDDTKGGTPDADDTKVNGKGFRESVIFRIEPEVRVTGYDPLFNTYNKKITYHVYGYVTQRPVLSQTQIMQAQNDSVQKAMVEAFVRRGLMRRAYHYLFTGKNTEILDLNLSYNLLWSAQLPRIVRDETARKHLHFKKALSKETMALLAGDIVTAYGAAISERATALAEQKQIADDPNASEEDKNTIATRTAEADANVALLSNRIATIRAELNAKLPKFDATVLRKGQDVIAESLSPDDLPEINDLSLSLVHATNEVKNALSNGMSGQYHGGKSLYGAILNQLHGDMTSQFLNITMKVRGDPYWIGPANLEQVVNLSSASRKDKKTYTADYTLGDNVFLLNFAYPTGIDANGNPIIRQNESVTAIYAVTKVNHEFSGGQFSQTLDAYRLPLINVFKASVVARNSSTDNE